MNNLMHIVSDEEYRAYIELTVTVRNFLYRKPDETGVAREMGLHYAVDRAIAAHNKRLNSIKRAQGT